MTITTLRVRRQLSSTLLGFASLIVAGSMAGTALAAGPAVGTISTIAGTGTGGFNGDLGQAIAAQLNNPTSTAIDAAGNVYIADQVNHRIRKVTVATGVISTVAGTGAPGSLGDGGAATAAMLSSPRGIAFDAAGNLYIADYNNSRIRRVAAGTGIITTVAGSGLAAYGGDGGIATAAQLNYPTGVTLDAAGNLYIADQSNHRVRMVSAATNVITTLAGNGTPGYNGDGLGTGVSLNNPQDVAVDGAGNVYIADRDNHRVRKVTGGVVSTPAGTGTAGFAGENGPGTAARLGFPGSVEVDAAGNVYIADQTEPPVPPMTPPGPTTGFAS
jgi:trimeric autotransporter adhesin